MHPSIEDPRVHARHYYRSLPTHAVAVDEPWWWPVLALGTGLINVHFQCNYRGPLAIVSKEQKPWHRNRDVQALVDVLKADGRPSFNGYSCPKAPGRIVGLVDVVDCVEDPKEPTLWFVGPYALIVEKPCMLPFAQAPTLDPAQGLISLTEQKQQTIAYALTALAGGASPGTDRRN